MPIDLPYVADPTRYDTMEYRRCGRSGLKLPAISLGLWHNFGNDRGWEGQRDICRRAFDLGVTHFDLANNYGGLLEESVRIAGLFLGLLLLVQGAGFVAIRASKGVGCGTACQGVRASRPRQRQPAPWRCAGAGGHGRVDRTGPGALVAGGAQRGAAVGLGQGTQAAVAAGAGQAFARVMRIFWDGRQLCVESSA